MIFRALQLRSKRYVFHALFVPVITWQFPTEPTLAYQSVMEPDPVSLNRQHFRNTKLSCRIRVAVGLDEAYSYLCCNSSPDKSKTIISRSPVHPYLKMLLVQRILKRPSLLVAQANIEWSMEEPQISGSQHWKAPRRVWQPLLRS